jgi:hypothetical protein
MSKLKRMIGRITASIVVFLLLFQASPLPVFASMPAKDLHPISHTITLKKDVVREKLKGALQTVKGDLAYLKKHGKEKFNTRMFKRMDRDNEHMLKQLKHVLTVYGPKKFVQIMLGWANPAIQQLVQSILTFTMEAVYEALEPFIRKGLQRIKEELVRISTYYIELGLKKIIALLSRDDILSDENLQFAEKSHFEDFFSNSTVVKNFLIAIVSVAAVAVGIGISLSTGGVAPIVAVLGGLVSLIGLIDGKELIEDEQLILMNQ